MHHGLHELDPHVVTVTWPDGHQEAFDFTPDGGSNIFWTGTATFTGRARSTSTLAVDGSNEISFRGDGNLYVGSFGSSTLFDPQRFRLTAKDGTVYVLDLSTGLVSATTRNGDTLAVSSKGVTSSRGPSITFHRDPTHRNPFDHGTLGRDADVRVRRGRPGQLYRCCPQHHRIYVRRAAQPADDERPRWSSDPDRDVRGRPVVDRDRRHRQDDHAHAERRGSTAGHRRPQQQTDDDLLVRRLWRHGSDRPGVRRSRH